MLSWTGAYSEARLALPEVKDKFFAEKAEPFTSMKTSYNNGGNNGCSRIFSMPPIRSPVLPPKMPLVNSISREVV